jgi:hypothetical protein
VYRSLEGRGLCLSLNRSPYNLTGGWCAESSPGLCTLFRLLMLYLHWSVMVDGARHRVYRDTIDRRGLYFRLTPQHVLQDSVLSLFGLSHSTAGLLSPLHLRQRATSFLIMTKTFKHILSTFSSNLNVSSILVYIQTFRSPFWFRSWKAHELCCSQRKAKVCLMVLNSHCIGVIETYEYGLLM